MFTMSKSAALRDVLFGWRPFDAAGAATLSALAFLLGVLAAPALG